MRAGDARDHPVGLQDFPLRTFGSKCVLGQCRKQGRKRNDQMDIVQTRSGVIGHPHIVVAGLLEVASLLQPQVGMRM